MSSNKTSWDDKEWDEEIPPAQADDSYRRPLLGHDHTTSTIEGAEAYERQRSLEDLQGDYGDVCDDDVDGADTNEE